MIIVSDTSPLSNLLIVGHSAIIHQLYGQVVIPPAIFRELRQLESLNINPDEILTAHWLTVRSPENTALVEQLLVDLDAGEAEGIALALELDADRLLIDERLGRAIATRYGVQITGLLGILRAAKHLGIIPRVKPILDDLMNQAGFRVSKDLYDRTLQDAGESPNSN